MRTRFSIVKRSKGPSAVEKASYISRSVLVSEYDGQTYRPKYHEDLVHSEITLLPNAPKEYADFVDKRMCADWAIHIDAVANALERKGIQYAKIKNAAVNVKNEALEMVERVQEKMGRLALPIVSATA